MPYGGQFVRKIRCCCQWFSFPDISSTADEQFWQPWSVIVDGAACDLPHVGHQWRFAHAISRIRTRWPQRLAVGTCCIANCVKIGCASRLVLSALFPHLRAMLSEPVEVLQRRTLWGGVSYSSIFVFATSLLFSSVADYSSASFIVTSIARLLNLWLVLRASSSFRLYHRLHDYGLFFGIPKWAQYTQLSLSIRRLFAFWFVGSVPSSRLRFFGIPNDF